MVLPVLEAWERTFNVNWGGVYFSRGAFLPLLLAAPEGHVINTSSVNGFFASVGFLAPHTAYCASKFAIKGFSEALINDFRLNAPHIKVSVVMPGYIGTGIAKNSRKEAIYGAGTALELQRARELARKRARRVAEMQKVSVEFTGRLLGWGENFRKSTGPVRGAERGDPKISSAEIIRDLVDGEDIPRAVMNLREDVHLEPMITFDGTFLEHRDPRLGRIREADAKKSSGSTGRTCPRSSAPRKIGMAVPHALERVASFGAYLSYTHLDGGVGGSFAGGRVR